MGFVNKSSQIFDTLRFYCKIQIFMILINLSYLDNKRPRICLKGFNKRYFVNRLNISGNWVSKGLWEIN